VKGKVNTILFTKHADSYILIVQIYVGDIIFGSTNEVLCKNFESCMRKEFEMSYGRAQLLSWTPNQAKE